MNKFWLLVLVIVLVVGPRPCQASSSAEDALFRGAGAAFASCHNLQGVHVLQNGKVVCLRGKIDPTMFVDLMKIRAKIAQHPFVAISGPGGEVDASIYLVRELDRFDPIPVSGDMCASACAQFLFLMGNQRVMLHCADVTMHGGPESVDHFLMANTSDKNKQSLIATMWRFVKFYKDRGISLNMVSKPPADIQKMLDAGQIVFWPWSINQLRAFGVKGIISENDPNRVVPKDFDKVCVKPLPTTAKGIGIGGDGNDHRAPPTPPGMRVRTGRFEELRS